jgi:hypothetical protein
MHVAFAKNKFEYDYLQPNISGRRQRHREELRGWWQKRGKSYEVRRIISKPLCHSTCGTTIKTIKKKKRDGKTIEFALCEVEGFFRTTKSERAFYRTFWKASDLSAGRACPAYTDGPLMCEFFGSSWRRKTKVMCVDLEHLSLVSAQIRCIYVHVPIMDHNAYKKYYLIMYFRIMSAPIVFLEV